MTQRASIEVSGLVQGVGFRPFVYTLASSLGLRGFVQNRGPLLFVDIEGEPSALDAFVDRLALAPPRHARIERIQRRALPPSRRRHFVIAESDPTGAGHICVPPDVATCDDCVRELFDAGDRRYRHPFIACATCGPRYSMVTKLPFDRADTTMAAFPMCDACRAEYVDPLDRRFHAQAIACPHCGPRLVARDRRRALAHHDAAIGLSVQVLRAGGIVAVKGLGGFHLACDATDERAVAELRRRKAREAKPFAVMFPDLEGRQLVAARGPEALATATSPERPIVLMDRDKRLHDIGRLANNVAAGSPAVGLLLPYTPIHHLLLHEVNRPLVMTSGNRSDEPMACTDEDAREQLGDIADLWLTHDRRIAVRCDDTVVRVHAGTVAPIRRARGQAPSPLMLAETSSTNLLAVGGHLKNTFCLVRGDRAYTSQHIGHLETAASYRAFADGVAQMSGLLDIAPEVIAHDLHPDYLSTRFAYERPEIKRIAVQHHHAHVLSCVAEHRCTEPVIGVAFDGAGLGDDGAIWGGEFLVVDGVQCHRAAHLAYVPLPGGDAASREPWRMAVAHLAAAFGSDLGPLGASIAERIAPPRMAFIRQMVARGTCAPATSSMGRLFDAVASLIGLRDTAAFEGQAAMELEAIASGAGDGRYQFELDTSGPCWTVEAAPVIRAIVADILAKRSRGEIAAAFHDAVSDMIATVALRISRQTGIRRIVLTGGVFQNARLSARAASSLRSHDLEVLEHRHVPCNDGGLSLGQALLALRRVAAGVAEEDRSVCA